MNALLLAVFVHLERGVRVARRWSLLGTAAVVGALVLQAAGYRDLSATAIGVAGLAWLLAYDRLSRAVVAAAKQTRDRTR